MSILLAPNVLLWTTNSTEDDAQCSLKWGFRVIVIPIPRSKPINIILNKIGWGHAPPLRV